MDWIKELWFTHSIGQAIIVYGLLISIGLSLGKLRIFGTSLGSTWILFTALLAAYLGVSTDEGIIHFMRDFGLILFVYSIGLQVGPGFFSALKQNALSTNLLAGGIVITGILIALCFIVFSSIPFYEVVGVMSGAVTNTPGLGAAQAAINDLNRSSVDSAHMTVAYALSYPFGVFGIILALIILRKLFGVSIPREKLLHHRLALIKSNRVISMHLNLENDRLVGQPLKTLFNMVSEPIIVSRMINDGHILTPTPDTILARGDVLLIVAPRSIRKNLYLIIGNPSDVDLKQASTRILVDLTVVVTRNYVTHKRLGDIPELRGQNFTLTRLNRAGIELIPKGDLYLQLGDRVKIVGTEEGVNHAANALGNSLKKLEVPELAPIFFGIVLGIILGSIPITVPGIPIAVKLGLAAGPLIIALALSRFGGMLYLNNYTTVSANLLLREIGITFFLASVGLSSGGDLGEAFTSGRGWLWIGMGLVITLVPLLLGGWVAKKYLRKTYFEICGLLAGASTDPPALSFAIKTAGSDVPSTTYATVYPLAMILRIVGAQLLVLLFA